MAFFKKSIQKFYCAFCKSPRFIKKQKHVELFEISISIVGSILLMLLFFQKFDFRVFVFFGILVSLFEFLLQLKYRLSMTCSHCGFDPLLYIKSKSKACAQVQMHLESRKNNPDVYMSSRPRLDLPIVKTKKDFMGREKKIVVNTSRVAKNLDLKL